MQSHGPKIAQGGIVADFDAASVKSYPNGNILGWGSWLNLSSSYQPVDTNVTYQLNQTASGENARIYDTDPWGNSNVVWQSYPSGDGNADGGWTTTAFLVDPTKLYRFSIWARRVSSTTGGNFYFGCYGDVGMGQVGSPGTNNGNPYWECFNISGFGIQNQWYLIVGHIFPVSYTGSTAHPDTGWYLPGNPNKIQNIGGCNIGVDCQWLAGTSYGYHRVYHYYCGDNTSHLQFFQPRVEIIDGITNPTIADLVNNRGSVWSDKSSNADATKLSTWNYSTLGGGSMANSTTGTGGALGIAVPLSNLNAQVYMWGGGGGSGGGSNAGSGGGGGYAEGVVKFTSENTYNITVGGGGSSQTPGAGPGTAPAGGGGIVGSYGYGGVGGGYTGIFKSFGTSSIPSSVNYLVVAGGGGGGGNLGGGGGAGGLLTGTLSISPNTSYTVTVGGGGNGSGNNSNSGSQGSSSSFSSVSTTGGGAGGGTFSSGGNGGSGGGSGGDVSCCGGLGTSGQGNSGGSSYSGNAAPSYPAGGGGGAGGAGASTSGSNPHYAGNGGAGYTWSYTGATYAGGGGGGVNGFAGSGGSGGGGNGGNGDNNSYGEGNSYNPTSGTTNTGGGGGGGGGGNMSGGSGGSGVVIIAYAGSQIATGGTVTSSGGYTIHTFTSSGSFAVTGGAANTQSNVILMAGGGGGGAYDTVVNGGAGGGLAGAAGDPGSGSPANTCGGGGTQIAGGSASNASGSIAGSALQGGNPGTSGDSGGGGGGGGGYFGGGGGAGTNNGASGGGGSGFYNIAYVLNPVLKTGSDATPGNSNSALRGSYGNGGAQQGVNAGTQGVCIIQYPGDTAVATGGTVTTSNGLVTHTFTSSGTFSLNTSYTQGIGTSNGLLSYNQFPKQNGTVEIWAYPTSWNGSNGLFVNRNDDTNNAVDWWWLGVWSSGGYLYFRLGDGSTCCNNDMNYSGWSGMHALNTWGHYVVTWVNNGTAIVYFNGTAVMSRTIGYVPPTNTENTGSIGVGHIASNSAWLGNIATTRIYNRPLSPNEVIQNFNAQRKRFGL